MPIEFYFTPELHLKDGRIIRDLEDAASFAREHELRPGIDQRDEVLHKLERAESRETAHAAAHFFMRWAEELDLLDLVIATKSKVLLKRRAENST